MTSMFSRKKEQQEFDVVVLRDAHVIEAALRRALDGAAPGERPGLERALELATRTAQESEGTLRARWVHDRLSAAGFQGAPDSVEAVRVLREQVPGLDLPSAAILARNAAAHTQAE